MHSHKTHIIVQNFKILKRTIDYKIYLYKQDRGGCRGGGGHRGTRPPVVVSRSDKTYFSRKIHMNFYV